jgi:hypothetical protein
MEGSGSGSVQINYGSRTLGKVYIDFRFGCYCTLLYNVCQSKRIDRIEGT